jgi:transaldolase
MIKIPGTIESLPAIEEAIYAGIPINVTLLFSREHYFAAAEAFLRGIERRIDAGLKPDVASVASVFVSRWDSAVADSAPEGLRGQLAIAVAKRTYKAYRSLLSSPRWQRVYNAGARPQRLLWASTGTKDPRCRTHVHQGAGRTVYSQHHSGDVERARGSGRLPGSCRPTATAKVLARFAGAGVACRRSPTRLQRTAPRRS